MSRTIRQRRQRQRTRATRRKQLAIVLVLLVIGALGGTAFGAYRYLGVAKYPKFDQLKPRLIGQNSIVYAADGSKMGVIQSDENRSIVTYPQMGPWMPKAIVAIEDRRFYSHHGVDYKGILRAAQDDLENHASDQGASTITQQLVRNLYPNVGTEKNIKRKAKEAYEATQLEKHWDKQKILTTYLNLVFFGNNAYGVDAAAETYFSVHAKNLTLGEAAVIAGLPQAPTDYDPIKDTKAATQRRNDVLKAMYETKQISAAQYTETVAQPIKLRVGKTFTVHRQPYFFDFVQQQLIKQYGSEAIRNGGLEVHTTIDPRLQKLAQDAISDTLDEPGDPEAAVVSLDTRTGQIKAMAGSTDYSQSKFNLPAEAQRQPGSTAKIWALATMVSEDIDPETTYYTSMPINVQLPGSTEPWAPKTYEGTYGGSMNVDTATVKSDNTVFAQISMDLGPANIVAEAHKMGITSHLDPYYSIVLGSEVVTPLEQTNFYSSIARGGVRIDPSAVSSITPIGGGSFKTKKSKPARVMQDWQAAEIIKILGNNVHYGTGVAGDFGWQEAGKTGTTDDHKDAWFCGMTPQLTTCVWEGYQIPRYMVVHGIEQQGASFPTIIWRKFMEPAVKLVSHDTDTPWYTPKGTPTFVDFHSTWQTNPIFKSLGGTGVIQGPYSGKNGSASSTGDPATSSTDGTGTDGITGDGTDATGATTPATGATAPATGATAPATGAATPAAPAGTPAAPAATPAAAVAPAAAKAAHR